MTASTATPSARDLVNDGNKKKKIERAKHLGSQTRTVQTPADRERASGSGTFKQA